MAEYYPLLSRAIARLGASTPEARRDVFERARKALLTQLRSIEPPAAEEDIDRENRALDDAAAQIEAEISADAAAATPPVSPVPVAVEPPPASPAEPTAPTVPTIVAQAPATEAPQLLPERELKPDPPAVSVAPPAPVTVRPPVPRVDFNPAEGEGGAPLLGVQDRSGDGKMSTVSAPLIAPEGLLATPASPKESWFAGFARARTKVGRSDGDTFSRERLASDEPAEKIEPLRPVAPELQTARTSFVRLWLFGFVLIALVGGVAFLAFKLKDNPGDFGRRAAVPEPEIAVPSGKIVERVGAGTVRATPESSAPPPPVQTVQTRPPTAPSTPSAQAPQASVMSVSQVAALVVDAPDEPQKIKAYVGTAIWRSESGFDGLSVVSVTLDIPEAGLSAVMRISKNTDAKLTAANLIELRFKVTPDSVAPGVKDVGTPQMRNEDRPSGDPLAGAPAKITDNYFLIGLNGGDSLAHNIDLIRSRGWFDLPILLTNDKIAKITFQKGATGDRILNDAFAAWGN